MAVIYGWTYAIFHTTVGWDKGTEAIYNYWENHWANRVNSYVFDTAGSLFTDADEITEIATLVNKMMIQTNLFLKGEANETPMQSGFYSNPGFPDFSGYPDDNKGQGSGDYIMLNKYKEKYGETLARVDLVRIGVDPDNVSFPVRGRY